MANRAQPIKFVAFERGITQQRFSVDAHIPYLVVHRVFNGLQSPTDAFIAKASKYFDLPEAALFDKVEPIRVSHPLNTRAARQGRALTKTRTSKASGPR